MVSSDHTARHLVVGEHELHVDVELVVREEPRQGLECLVRSPAGQEPLASLPSVSLDGATGRPFWTLEYRVA